MHCVIEPLPRAKRPAIPAVTEDMEDIILFWTRGGNFDNRAHIPYVTDHVVPVRKINAPPPQPSQEVQPEPPADPTTPRPAHWLNGSKKRSAGSSTSVAGKKAKIAPGKFQYYSTIVLI